MAKSSLLLPALSFTSISYGVCTSAATSPPSSSSSSLPSFPPNSTAAVPTLPDSSAGFVPPCVASHRLPPFKPRDRWRGAKCPRRLLEVARPCSCWCRQSREIEILHGLSGNLFAGEMVAVMGPSGCGKSSLLNALAKSVPGKIHGVVQAPTKSHVALMGQNESFFPRFTIYETLRYVALLSLGNRMKYSNKMHRVEEVMELCNLTRCRNTPVGTTMLRGCSGGEIKRLSIACQLLRSPSVLLLDEPTTGLDATAARNLVFWIRQLANSKRMAVVCVVHQPSGTVFSYFDRLILMTRGQFVYQGRCDARSLYEYFGSVEKGLGGVNLMEYISEVSSCTTDVFIDAYKHRVRVDASGRYVCVGEGASGDRRLSMSSVSTRDTSKRLHAHEQCGEEGRKVGGKAEENGKRKKLAQGREDGEKMVQYHEYSVGCLSDASRYNRVALLMNLSHEERRELLGRRKKHLLHITHADKPKSVRSFCKDVGKAAHCVQDLPRNRTDTLQTCLPAEDGTPSVARQVYWLFHRCFSRELKDTLNIIRLLVMPIAILIGLLSFNLIPFASTSSVSSLGGSLLFWPTMWCLIPLTERVGPMFESKPVYACEIRSGLYHPFALFMGKSIADILVLSIFPTATFVTAFPMMGIRWKPDVVIGSWGSIILISWAAGTLAELVGLLCESPEQAYSMGFAVSCANAFFGGFFNVGEVPVWLSWLKWITIMRYGSQVFLLTILAYETMPCPPQGVVYAGPCPLPATEAMSVFLEPGMPSAVAGCGLVAIGILFKTLTYLVMRYGGVFKVR